MILEFSRFHHFFPKLPLGAKMKSLLNAGWDIILESIVVAIAAKRSKKAMPRKYLGEQTEFTLCLGKL